MIEESRKSSARFAPLGVLHQENNNCSLSLINLKQNYLNVALFHRGRRIKTTSLGLEVDSEMIGPRDGNGEHVGDPHYPTSKHVLNMREREQIILLLLMKCP